MAAMAVADAGGRCWRRRRTRRGRQRWAAANRWMAEMPTAWLRGRRRSGAGGDGGGGVSGGEGGGGEGERRQRPQRPQGRQCLRPAPPSSGFSPPGQLHIVVHVEVHEPRVRTVCRGMTVCARCYIMFVYLKRSFLISFEHTNTDRAVTCALSRAKSEKKRGGACAHLR